MADNKHTTQPFTLTRFKTVKAHFGTTFRMLCWNIWMPANGGGRNKEMPQWEPFAMKHRLPDILKRIFRERYHLICLSEVPADILVQLGEEFRKRGYRMDATEYTRRTLWTPDGTKTRNSPAYLVSAVYNIEPVDVALKNMETPWVWESVSALNVLEKRTYGHERDPGKNWTVQVIRLTYQSDKPPWRRRVAVYHLHAPFPKKGIHQLLEALAGYAEEEENEMIVCGDMNTFPDSLAEEEEGSTDWANIGGRRMVAQFVKKTGFKSVLTDVLGKGAYTFEGAPWDQKYKKFLAPLGEWARFPLDQQFASKGLVPTLVGVDIPSHTLVNGVLVPASDHAAVETYYHI